MNYCYRDIAVFKSVRDTVRHFFIRGGGIFFALLLAVGFGERVGAQTCPSGLNITTQPVSQTDCHTNGVQFDVVISGGAAPITYTWQRKKPLDPGFTDIVGDPTITYPSAGSILVSNIGVGGDNIDQTQYKVVVIDACGTVTSIPATLTINDITTITPSFLTPSITSVEICQGTTITYTVATQGQTPTSIQWRKDLVNLSDGEAYSGVTTNTLTITNPTTAQSGSYSVTVVFPITTPNNNGVGVTTCQQTSSLARALNVFASCAANAGSDQPVCASSPNVTLAGVVGGGAASGVWSGGSGTFNPNNTTLNAVYTPSAAEIAAGSVTLTLTTNDPSGPCTPVSDQMVITINANPTATSSHTNVLCNGGTTGTINAVGANGTGPYSYVIAGPTVNTTGASSGVFTGLSAGSYIVTVTDAKGCTIITSQTITQPIVLSATSSSTNVLCNGGTTGTMTAVGANGTSPYTYVIAGPVVNTTGASSGVFTGLSVGTYTVTVTDANGCTTITQQIITQPTLLTASSSHANVLCNGGTTGAMTAVGANGTSPYTYVIAGPVVNTTGASSGVFTGLSVGTYTVTVTDANGCTTTTQQIITQPVALSATSSHTDVLCFGGTTGTMTAVGANGTSPYTYVIAGPVVNTTGASSGIFTGLSVGFYTITVTDANGCTTTTTQIITQPAVALALIETHVNVLCNSASTGSINITALGGTSPYTYDWADIAGTSNSEDRTNLPAGTYTVTVTDANGCSTAPLNVTITQPATAIAVALTSQTNVLCFGASTGAINITASGGTGAYTYDWADIAGTSNPEDRTNLPAGTYTVTVTDANGCTTIPLAVTITQPASAVAVALTSQTNVLCFGASTGAINITASGGTGAYTYDWADIAGTSNPEDRTNLPAGTYTVTVTDANGCSTAPLAVTITQPASAVAVVLTSQTNVLCFGASTGAINITASGGTGAYTYDWADIAGTSNPEDRTNLPAGTYTVTVTDANGCSTAPLNVTITQPASAVAVVLTSQTNVLCFGASTGAINITASGGTGAYTYDWADIAGTSNPEDRTNLSAGTYTVTVTDANGCTTAPLNVTITQPASAVTVALTSQTNVLCFGASTGAINITASGGTGAYTYAWTGTGVNATAEDQTGLAAGNYSVVVTDANGCSTAPLAVTITQPVTAVAVALTSQTNVLCFGASTGTINITASGGTGAYTYDWADIAGTNNPEDRTNLAAGTYTVTVTDANGCTTAPLAITITQPATPASINTISSNSPVCSDNTLSLTSTASGGTGVITYSWTGPNSFTSNLQNPSIASVQTVASGTYTLTVTDANGCTATATTNVTITQRPSVVLSYSASAYCINNGTAQNPVLSSGVGAYTGGTYTSSPGGLALNFSTGAITPNSSLAGTYTITYTIPASGGCPTVPTTTTVTITPVPTVTTLVYAGSPFCSTVATSQAVTLIGTNAYTGGTFTSTPAGLTLDAATGAVIPSTSTPGTYNVTYTSLASGGCAAVSITGTVTITVLPTATIAYPGGPFCSNGGLISVTHTGATGGNYTGTSGLQINNSNGSINLGTSSTGNHTVTYTIPAANGCPAVTTTATLTINPLPAAVINYAGGPFCPTNTNVTVTITGTTGGTFSAPAGLSINSTTGAINASTSTLGTYTVTYTIAAANGCPAVTATSSVTIGDNVAPVIIVPSNINIQCGASTLPANTGQATATDNCTASGSIAITYSDATVTGNCTGRYTITRTWTATDANGNVTTGTQTINVDDTTPPVITCSNFNVANPNAIPDANSNTVTATDNCGGTITVTMINESYTGLSNAPGFCPTSVIRVWQATDACGNVATCTQTITVLDVSNCSVCQSNVPFFPANLDGNPDSLWISPSTVRDGLCCGATGPPPPKCVSFNVFLDEDAVGLIFNIASGAIPGGAMFYQIDCGPATPVGQPICLAGGQFYTITFCKPGNNANTYSIQSISGATGASTLTTRADVACSGTITVTGLTPGTITWTVVSPANPALLSYLSCTNCANPVFTPNASAPGSIVYRVCGTVATSVLCNGQPITDCKDVTVNILPPITVQVTVPPIICSSSIPQVTASVIPSGTYNYQWYSAANGSGSVLSTSLTGFTPPAAGTYSLVVAETKTGLLCNKDTTNYTIAFDLTAPVLTVPSPLFVECNSSGAASAITAWLATATAYDQTNPSHALTVTNNYATFAHTCGGSRIVTFSTVDSCGNVRTDTSSIRIIDTSPPSITCPPTITVSCPPIPASNLAAFIAQGGLATDICDATPTITFVSDVISNQTCPNTYTVTRTYQAADDCGNVSTCTQTIFVNNTNPPVVPPNGQSTVQCIAGAVVPTPPVITDACGAVVTPVMTQNTNPSCEGAKIYTFTYTECTGLSSIWTYTYLIDRTTAPVAAPVSGASTVACPNATDVAPALPVVTDICGNVLTPSAPVISAKPTCEGTRTYTYTYADCSGLSTTWVYTYTVEFQPFADPVDAGSTVSCPDATDVAPTAFLPTVTDNCGTVLTPSAPVISAKPTCNGTRTYTYTYTDCEGNTQNWVYTYTILDNVVPVVTGTLNTLTIEGCSVATAPAAVTTVAALEAMEVNISDNCSSDAQLVVTSSTVSAGTCPVVVTRTYTITDLCGNITTITQTINVNDTQAPAVTGALNSITVEGCSAATAPVAVT
ncbi:MAG TPA: hypothetical protein VF487_19875, partial [Chitinophagaceae bacterium]